MFGLSRSVLSKDNQLRSLGINDNMFSAYNNLDTDDVDVIVNKGYTKVDHIVGIRTLDILIYDMYNGSIANAVDLYLRVTNEKYAKYSGVIKLLTDNKDSYLKTVMIDGNCLMHKGYEVPNIEYMVRKKLLANGKKMYRFIDKSMNNVVKNKYNKSKHDLVEISKLRISPNMVEAYTHFNQYAEDIMGDYSSLIVALHDYNQKLANKARVALIYKETENNEQINSINDLLVYSKYNIEVVYKQTKDGSTYDIITKLLRDKISDDYLEQMDAFIVGMKEKLKANKEKYRNLYNTELTTEIIIEVLDCIK